MPSRSWTTFVCSLLLISLVPFACYVDLHKLVPDYKHSLQAHPLVYCSYLGPVVSDFKVDIWGRATYLPPCGA